jgi:hypothetical protein
MTQDEMTCEQFEERLADYMEGEITAAERAQMDAHAASCIACGALLSDLQRIVAEAAELPEIAPPAAVWSGIESRISTAIVPIATHRRSIPLVRALTSAAAMILLTATATYIATVKYMSDSHTPVSNTAQSVAQRPANTTPAGISSVEGDSSTTQIDKPNASYPTSVERGVPDAGSSSVRTVSRADRTRSRTANAASVYDAEIARLRSVIKRRDDLDPKTIATIQRSLAVIDTAITQARAAVAADPASAFLNQRLADAQTKKVELLRTAAMLPST